MHPLPEKPLDSTQAFANTCNKKNKLPSCLDICNKRTETCS